MGEETEDSLLAGRVRFFQPRTGYRAAMDPVLLAAAVPAATDDKVLDVGAGAGAAALCLAFRVARTRITGIEKEPVLAAIASRNARVNGLADRVDFLAGDLLAPPSELAPGSFDHVMANPPFQMAGRGTPSADPVKRAATMEGDTELGDWLDFCLHMVRHKGSVTVIHRAERLDALLAGLRGRLGGITLFPLWPGSTGKPAKRIILSGRKGTAAPLSLAAGLVLHEADGTFTAAAETVLRDAKNLLL
jgi:tRNA1(Val) A37 N6-methylase TrmN6